MGLFDDIIESAVDVKPMNFRPACGISCSQSAHCRSPKLFRPAKRKGGVMFLLDTPTAKQDSSGDPMRGSFGKYVMPIIDECGLDMGDVSIAFAVPCHGIDVLGLSASAYDIQMASCRPFLDELIGRFDPHLIVPMGKVAMNALVGSFEGRMDGVTFLSDLCFHMIPDQRIGRWIAPMIGPRHLAELYNDERKKDDAVFYERRLRQSLSAALRSDYHSFPRYDDLASKVHVMHTRDEAVGVLEYILRRKPEYLAFDYETDGIKIEREDMGIIMVGLSFADGTYAMPFFRDDEEFVGLFKRIMTDRDIGKIAHHAKYEARCTLVKMGVLPEPWSWDTMYAARLLNNVSMCNLKYLTYVNFGITGYDTMEKYIETPSEDPSVHGSNTRNSFRAACEDPVVMDCALLYVGQDALYTYMLAMRQMDAIARDRHLSKGERLFRGLINPLVDTEVNGIVIDGKVLDDSIRECREKFEAADKAVYEDSFLKKYWPSDAGQFDYNKDDLSKLLYEYGGIEKRFTEKGKLCDDADTLEEIGLPICGKVLEARKYAKVLDTYLMNIKRESVYDRKRDELLLHSTYNLHVASTFRSSCFVKGSPVMVVGRKAPVPIEEVKEGDYVYSFDSNLQSCIRRVTWSGCTGHDRHVVRVHWKSGRRKGYADCTPDHLFLLTTGEYVPAYDLLKGRSQEHVMSLDKKHIVCAVEDLGTTADVYDITVEDTHNFICGELAVHNCSGGINMQNIPVRDPEQNRLIRSCMVPPKGMRIYGLDYRAMEVCTGCCIHHDKNMLEFLKNDGDMHIASAKGCFLYTDEEWDAEDPALKKKIRGAGKNKFNFPSFYGSYYKQTSVALYKFATKYDALMSHLKSKGINSFEDYEEVIQSMDKNLWEKQFPEYGQWRKEIYEFYKKHGYVDLITGFRCYGPMSRNNSTNSPIQGVSAHVLLWSHGQIRNELKKRKMRSFLFNEIHDANYGAVHPDEEEDFRLISRKWMIEEVPNKFKWFTAPIAVELEYTGLREEGGCWANLEEFGYI